MQVISCCNGAWAILPWFVFNIPCLLESIPHSCKDTSGGSNSSRDTCSHSNMPKNTLCHGFCQITPCWILWVAWKGNPNPPPGQWNDSDILIFSVWKSSFNKFWKFRHGLGDRGIFYVAFRSINLQSFIASTNHKNIILQWHCESDGNRIKV